MPLFTEQTIYCSGCGRPYKVNFNLGWISSMARARVCGVECKAVVEAAYTRCVMGRPDPRDTDVPHTLNTQHLHYDPR